MSGLVARSFIENIRYDEHVRKLITVNTPHRGSDMAITYCETGWAYAIGNHKACDHDLHSNGKIFDGTNNQTISCTKDDCKNTSNYLFTDTLQYNNRSTQYYAIASIDGPTITDITSRMFRYFETTGTYCELLSTIKNHPYMDEN